MHFWFRVVAKQQQFNKTKKAWKQQLLKFNINNHFIKDHQKKISQFLILRQKNIIKLITIYLIHKLFISKPSKNQFTNNSIKKYMLKSLNNLFFSKKSKMSQNYKEENQPVNIQMCQSTGGSKLIRWQDGTVYIGQWVGQAMNGVGKLRYPSGDYYQGQFKDNNFHGAGKYFGQNGIYEGQWQNGLKSGFGKQKNLDGSNFVGTYDKGLKSGIGLFEWIDGSFYQGMFKQDRMEGPGKMVYGDGSKVEGEWKQNQIHGIGRQTDREGNIYIGSYQKGMKNGNGILIEKSLKIEGIWLKGQLKCAVLIESNDRRAFCVKYEENNLIKICDESYQELKDQLNYNELILSE